MQKHFPTTTLRHGNRSGKTATRSQLPPKKAMQHVKKKPDDHAPVPEPMRTIAVATCPVCGCAGNKQYEHLIDRASIVAGEWSARLCSNSACETYWLDPMPVAEDIHKAYATYYTHTNGETSQRWPAWLESLALCIAGGLKKLWLQALFLAVERENLETMFLANLPAGRVLEVGCGSGALLRRLRDLGWTVEGQDVDPNAASIADDDIVVHLGDLNALALPSESYDAVVMNHVIEHVHAPVELLRECFRLTKPGGILVITTPNINSYGHRIFGDAWVGLDPPRHLHIFSTKSLMNLVSSAGWISQKTFTTPARAGGIVATSRDIKRTGFHQMGGRTSLVHLMFVAWYQFAARLNHVRRPEAGEEIVLIACK